jgi:predicted DNA-binding helix-hairpin-helix protein
MLINSDFEPVNNSSKMFVLVLCILFVNYRMFPAEFLTRCFGADFAGIYESKLLILLCEISLNLKCSELLLNRLLLATEVEVLDTSGLIGRVRGRNSGFLILDRPLPC